MKKIAIIGYGELGRAIHKVLKQKSGLDIKVYDKKGGQGQLALDESVSSANLIFICVPSWCVREALADIKPFLDKKALVVCMAKGIEETTLKTMDIVLSEELGDKAKTAILSGPMLAEELSAGKKGFAVAASKNKKDFARLEEIFHSTGLAVEYSKDLRGIALCGVLKNIYALGLGIVDGLELGGNTKGKLSAIAIMEMMAAVKLLGGKEKTALGIAGAGDFITTGFSRYSRNREVGEELAKTGVCCLESEGYKSIASIIKLLGKTNDKMLFLNALKSIILENQSPKTVFGELQNLCG